MEKSYFELRVTIFHIIIFLLALILLGVFLFFMGYRAAVNRIPLQTAKAESKEKTAEMQVKTEPAEEIIEEKPVVQEKTSAAAESSIQQELQMHQIQETVKKRETTSPASAELFVIQVGAFSDYQKAKAVAEDYRRQNYAVDIVAEIVRGKRLHLVRVGNFSTLREAETEKTKLENRSGQKFLVKKIR